MAAEELCLPASAPTPAFSNFRNADPLSWSQMDCLCPRNAHRPGCAGAPGTALAAAGSGESAGIGLFYGRAQATDSAEAAAEAAADALAKLEVDRAMGSYGRFDSSSGLVVATAGRSAPALAALLASTERGTLRKIVVANCSAGAKMAQALTFGIQEQIEAAAAARAGGADAAPQHVMSHAGGTTEEHAAWSAAVGGSDSATGTGDGAAGGGSATGTGDGAAGGTDGGAGTEGDDGAEGGDAEPAAAAAAEEDGQDWEALQAHLDDALPEPPTPAEVCVEGADEVLARVKAGEVHVVLVGADSVDPISGDAVVSAACTEACELAKAAKQQGGSGSGGGGTQVVVVCATWGEPPPDATVLEPEAQGLVVGLPPQPAIS
jgi:hypothetical protein